CDLCHPKIRIAAKVRLEHLVVVAQRGCEPELLSTPIDVRDGVAGCGPNESTDPCAQTEDRPRIRRLIPASPCKEGGEQSAVPTVFADRDRLHAQVRQRGA